MAPNVKLIDLRMTILCLWRRGTSIILYFTAAVCLSGCSEIGEDKQPTKTPESSPVYSDYKFSQTKNIIDFGDQPYWLPSSIITEYMFRDPILKEELEKKGFQIRKHHFLKGYDLNYFFKKGDLEVGVGGDMPSISIACEADVSFLSIFKGPVSIVSTNIRELDGLRGKKVGYSYGSNAHFFLLNTLENYGIKKTAVELIDMDVISMSRKLNEGEIDAYATWEFSPSTTMKILQDKTTIHKGVSYGFLYIRNDFFKDKPEIVHHLLASQVRAVNWIAADDKNVKLMSYWLYNELMSWRQKNEPLSLAQMVRHVKEAVTYIYYTSYPRIPDILLEKEGILNIGLQFLIENDLLEKNNIFTNVKDDIQKDYLDYVLSHPQQFRLYENNDSLSTQ